MTTSILTVNPSLITGPNGLVVNANTLPVVGSLLTALGVSLNLTIAAPPARIPGFPSGANAASAAFDLVSINAGLGGLQISGVNVGHMETGIDLATGAIECLAPTVTTVSASPTHAAFGAPVTFTASVVPNPASPTTPTGTVAFFLDGAATPVDVATLNGGTASVTLSGLGAGAHTMLASYSGDATFLPSSSAMQTTVTVSCGTNITGSRAGALVLGAGSTCIAGAHIAGSIVVPKGASMDLESSTVGGSIIANGPSFLRICGTSAGSATVNGASGFVVIGDARDGCATNNFSGSMILQKNTGGVQAIDNQVVGAVIAGGNSGAGPFPDDTAPQVTSLPH